MEVGRRGRVVVEGIQHSIEGVLLWRSWGLSITPYTKLSKYLSRFANPVPNISTGLSGATRCRAKHGRCEDLTSLSC